MPGVAGVLIPLLLASAVSIVLAGRNLRGWAVGISVVASQALFHTLFVLGAPATATVSTHSHGTHSMLSTLQVSTADGGAVADSGTGWAVALMTIHHLIAALVTAVAIWHGERAARSLATLATRFLRAAVLRVTNIPERARHIVWSSEAALISTWELRVLRGRAPPVFGGTTTICTY